MLDNMLELDIFKEDRMRPKDFSDWFMERTDEKKVDIVDRFAYGVEKMEELIMEMRAIARGEDSLNVSCEYTAPK